MPEIARNAPCPCGSGRKYKSCCLRQDRIAASRELHLDDGEAYLIGQLYQYAQSRRFSSDLIEAFHIYWGGAYDPIDVEEHDQEHLLAFLEYFFLDFRTSRDGQCIIELFIDAQAGQYPAPLPDILAAWSRAVPGMFRMELREDAEHINVHDCLRDRGLEIRDAMWASNAREGELFLGHLFELDGEQRLSHMTMLLPGDFEQPLRDYVTNAYELYHEEHHQADWERFLLENGHIFNAFLLSSRAERLRSLIGSPTRFRDPAELRDRLRAARQRREREALEEQAHEMGQLPEHRTSSGIILPGGSSSEADRGGSSDEGSGILLP